MLSFDEALARVLAAASLVEPEDVSIFDALGRTLRETLVAKTPFPRFDYGAMDGYAVRTLDFSGEGPWEFGVWGESRAGHAVPDFTPGTACRVFTGAPIPRGADAVVMQEDVERVADVARFRKRPSEGQHVRRAGEDLGEGAAALEAGTRLEAYQLGVVAALDLERVTVSRRPRVAIVATGDELRPAGAPGSPTTIPESNSVAIAALATRAGALVEVRDIADDDVGRARTRIAAALEGRDLIVTIGGVSVGDHDVVRPALEAAGVVLDFHKVAIKPGKPLTLGRRGDTVVLGLPGNPVSAQLTFALFGLPLLRKMQGGTPAAHAPRRLRLGAEIRQKPGRRGFYAAHASGDTVTPLAGQASGSIASLAWANALIVVPEDSAGFSAGDSADVFFLSEL